MIFQKNAADKLDFQVNWSLFLGTDTIASVVWTVPTGINKESESNTTTTTTIWLSGGSTGIYYTVTATITTAAGRIGSETIEVWITPAHILTISEAMNVLRMTESTQQVYDLLPLVDGYLYRATGHDWSKDAVIQPEAKAAARIVLTLWHENPGMIGNGNNLPLAFGLKSLLVQLEALALRYKEFIGINGAGGCDLPEAKVGDTVASLTGLIGSSGDQSAKFETVISVEGQIQQIYNGDLSTHYFRAYLVPVEGL